MRWSLSQDSLSNGESGREYLQMDTTTPKWSQTKTYQAIWIAILFVTTSISTCCANWVGVDDFNDNSNDETLWGVDMLAGGLLTEVNGRLEYSTSGVPTGNDLAIRPWNFSFGSYTQNWEIRVDINVPRMP